MVVPAASPFSVKASGASAGVFCGGAGNNKLVMLSGNQVISSVDGQTFNTRTLPVSASWSGRVSYGNGVFVAVASGSATAISSADGEVWTQQALPLSQTWYSCAFGAGIHLAAAGSVNYATTVDGVNWVQRAFPSAGSFTAVLYAFGQFWAFMAGNSACYTSVDGKTGWVSKSLPLAGNWEPHSMVMSSGKLLLLSNNNNTLLVTSDGVSWQTVALPVLPVSQSWRAVFGYAGGYAVVASNGNTCYTSQDLVNWSYRPLPFNGSCFIASVNSLWVIASSTSPQIAISNPNAFDIVYPIK
ncbi:hypothetical protein [Parachitinimonas caeni]|uniref:Photosynthesis system II assembly factor Ycf48/Hcf136-like domain-containing protein n=1 Tax=Parachitinimonas caeni TaxID=3031301 RepID=A0ABT7DRA8_9NEIS|nr:hypothetical protein [Parachitinimonas caeni]MDK2122608.1 hypothetical protein [Parachitinimonas caeni]